MLLQQYLSNPPALHFSNMLTAMGTNASLCVTALYMFLQIKKLEKERHELSIQKGTLQKEKKHLQHLPEKAQEKMAKATDIRVRKKERKAKMKEEREKRKQTMAGMNMKGRFTYLEEEIARLEEENYVSHLHSFGHADYNLFHFLHQCLITQLESSDSTCVLLSSKLDQAEARLNKLKEVPLDCISYIRELVDSLCRDGANTPIVHVQKPSKTPPY